MEIKKQKPPGKKLIKNMSLHTKWVITVMLGLILFSYGASILTQAGIIFHEGKDNTKAIILGFYSLLVLNGGLLIFGQAIVFRTKITAREVFKKEMKKRQKKLLKSKPLIPTKMTVENKP